METSVRKVRLEETKGGRSERESRKKQKKGKMAEVKRIAEEWEI